MFVARVSRPFIRITKRWNSSNNPFAEETMNSPVNKYNEVTPATRRKNLLTAFVLSGFIFGVYYYSMSKMKDVSFLYHSNLFNLMDAFL